MADSPLPSLVVFDLDFTLWDCGGLWIDCTQPPFQVIDGTVTDHSGRRFRLYEDCAEILDELEAEGIALALASRTEQPGWACEVLELMALRRRFDYEEIYPASKVRHFASLQRASGIPYQEMLFFDDESRNIREVSELGVTCILVDRGLDRRSYQLGLNEFGTAGSRASGE